MESLTARVTTGHWAALGGIVLLALVGVPWAVLARVGLVDPGYGAWAVVAMLDGAALAISATVLLVGHACGKARRQGVLVSTLALGVFGFAGAFLLGPLLRVPAMASICMALIAANVASRPGEKRVAVCAALAALWLVPTMVLGAIVFVIRPDAQMPFEALGRAMALLLGPWASLTPAGRDGVLLPLSVPVSVALTVLMGTSVDTALRARRTDIPGLCLVFSVPLILTWLAMGVLCLAPGLVLASR